jgi:hypothetical protein
MGLIREPLDVDFVFDPRPLTFKEGKMISDFIKADRLTRGKTIESDRLMKTIKGIAIPKLGFAPQKIGDLIYHEGPLLSLFIDRDNSENYFLYKWADCDKKVNRWLVVQLNAISLRNFFYKEISLRTLLLNGPVTYVLQLDDNLTESGILVCATSDLPENYLPKENSYYEEEKYSDFALAFKTILASSKTNELLNEILKEVSSLKKNQSNTQQLLRTLLSPQKGEKKISSVRSGEATTMTYTHKATKVNKQIKKSGLPKSTAKRQRVK